MAALAGVVVCLGRELQTTSPSAASFRRPSATAAAAVRAHVLGEAAGALPAGTTAFDVTIPGVARLDPALRAALQRAAVDAAQDGVTLVLDSGWRSRAYQENLLRQAILRYGSEQEAARWVATPGTSAHVSGKAVDVGRAAAAWLSGRGAAYGLCRVYGNEPWHFELRPVDRGCPPVYADAAHDPRLRR